MILSRDLRPIGKTLKPHGINGEIVILLTCDVDLSDLSCVIIEIDGIYVPFFIENVRPKSSDTDLVVIDGITDERSAAVICNKDLYGLKSEISTSDINAEEGLYANDLIGYDLVANKKNIGKISAIEDSTANCLFIIKKADGKECLLPIVDEFIDEINVEQQKVAMTVPSELLEL